MTRLEWLRELQARLAAEEAGHPVDGVAFVDGEPVSVQYVCGSGVDLARYRYREELVKAAPAFLAVASVAECLRDDLELGESTGGGDPYSLLPELRAALALLEEPAG